jgi:hypothetical protein
MLANVLAQAHKMVLAALALAFLVEKARELVLTLVLALAMALAVALTLATVTEQRGGVALKVLR